MLLGTLKGILVAVIVSLLSLAQQAYNPPVYALGRKRGTTVFRPLREEHPDDETWPGLLILRTEGRLFFANAERVADRMHGAPRRAPPRVLLLDCRAVFDIEYTALKVLAETDEKLRPKASRCGWLASTARRSRWCAAHRSASGSASGACSRTSMRRSGNSKRSFSETIAQRTINLRGRP